MAAFSKMILKTVLPYSSTVLGGKKKFSVEDLDFQVEIFRSAIKVSYNASPVSDTCNFSLILLLLGFFKFWNFSIFEFKYVSTDSL